MNSGQNRALYAIVKTDLERKILWIIDQCNGHQLSITNDAECVVEALHMVYPKFRIIYRDTMGKWDELLHEGPTFKGFAPARDMGVRA